MIISKDIHGLRVGPTIIMALFTVTFVISAPLAGTVVDSFNKKNVLIFSDVVRAILLIGYILVLRLLPPQLAIWFIYGFVFFVVAFCGVARAALWALVPEVVSKNDLPKVNTQLSVNNDIGMAVGAALGGWLMVHCSSSIAFTVDSATYVISAIFLWKFLSKLSLPQNSSEQINKTPPVSTKKFNLLFISEVFRSEQLTISLVLAMTTFFIAGMLNSYMIIVSQEWLSLPPSSIGYAYACWAVGGLLGGASLRVTGLRNLLLKSKLVKKMFFLTVFLGLIAPLIGTAASNFEFMAILIFIGATYTINSAILDTGAMQFCPPGMRGRFAALFNLVIRISMFLGLLTAPLLSKYSSGLNFVCLGTVSALCVIAYVYRKSRNREVETV